MLLKLDREFSFEFSIYLSQLIGYNLLVMCLVGLSDNLELLVVELVIKEEKVVIEFSFLALLNYLRV